MKEEYIRRVGRLLALPGKQKREVLRDLEEIFACWPQHLWPSRDAGHKAVETLKKTRSFRGFP